MHTMKVFKFGKIFAVFIVVKSLIKLTFSFSVIFFKCFLQLFWF